MKIVWFYVNCDLFSIFINYLFFLLWTLQNLEFLDRYFFFFSLSNSYNTATQPSSSKFVKYLPLVFHHSSVGCCVYWGCWYFMFRLCFSAVLFFSFVSSGVSFGSVATGELFLIKRIIWECIGKLVKITISEKYFNYFKILVFKNFLFSFF